MRSSRVSEKLVKAARLQPVTWSNELGDKRVKLRTKSLSELELTMGLRWTSLPGADEGHPAPWSHAQAHFLSRSLPRQVVAAICAILMRASVPSQSHSMK